MQRDTCGCCFAFRSSCLNLPPLESPPIPSSLVDAELAFATTSTPIPSISLFYSQSTSNRPVTPPQNASIPTSTPISKRHLGTTATPLRDHDRDSANNVLPETSGHFLGAMPPPKISRHVSPIGQDTPECPTRMELSRVY